ncbi:MAG TPA: carboxypeptidase-like regulatory domain-containing protein, partial [Vicinamibacterales bacterium]|nr:carboxypeptidase-like regulatory domain-containing protein [Vicinamibacterales bacterium]
MKRFAWVAAVGFASAVVAAQQEPVANGVILGKVVDAATKAPVAGVLVTVGVSPGSIPLASAPPQPIRALTDAQGRFVFRHLRPGSYAIAATTGSNGFEQSGFLVTGMGHLIAPYLNGGFGQRRPNGPLQNLRLDQGGVVSDVVIALWKGASIDGTVVDEANEPLVGLIVAAVRRTSDGVLTTGPTTRTDDRGMYHISALAPGDYVVVVPQTQVLLPVSAVEAAFAPAPDPLLGRQFSAAGAPSPSQAGIAIGGVLSASTPPVASNALLTPDTRVRHTYQSTFHPAATTLDQASVVTVRSGDEATDVDVRLTPVPSTRVSGALIDNGAPVPFFGVRLLPADSGDGTEVMEIASTSTDAQGRFTFPSVPMGQYRLFAQRPAGVPSGATPQGGVTYAEPRTLAETAGAWAVGGVTVADRPIEDVILTLRASFKVAGRAVFDGAMAAPPRDRLNQFSFSAVPARTSRRIAGPVSVSQIDTSGRISIASLSPGRYILKWPDLLPGWTVESVTVGGRDLTDAAFEIADSDIADLVVTFTDRPASITGAVRFAAAVADSDASVFL